VEPSRIDRPMNGIDQGLGRRSSDPSPCEGLGGLFRVAVRASPSTFERLRACFIPSGRRIHGLSKGQVPYDQ
jgi:hypothetical protein